MQPIHLYWGWRKPEDLPTINRPLSCCGASVLRSSGRIVADVEAVTCALCRKSANDPIPGLPEELKMSDEVRKEARTMAAKPNKAPAGAPAPKGAGVTPAKGVDAPVASPAADTAKKQRKTSGLEASGVEGRSTAKKASGPPKREVGKDQFDVAAVAAHLKIEPRLVRAALRKSSLKKPADGWVWDKKEWDKVLAVVVPK